MKKVSYVLFFISLILLLCVGILYADIYHAGKSFSISAGGMYSDPCTWTPAFNIPSGNLYMKTYANLANPTGLTEYYKVSPSGTSHPTSPIKIDGTIYTKNSSYGVSGGTAYNAFAMKTDSSLTISVSGKIYFYSKNNSN